MKAIRKLMRSHHTSVRGNDVRDGERRERVKETICESGLMAQNTHMRREAG